ncbi:MAG: carbon-nitrogen hydrolase family protein [Gemmatimonadota bacterium]
MTRVAAIQMTSTTDVEANLVDARRLIAEAAETGAALCVLPENFALMAGSRTQLLAAGEAYGAGPIQDAMGEAAKAHGIWVVAGSVPIATRDGDRVRAACIVYDAGGVAVARYDKIHLFDVVLEGGESHSESRTIEPGDEAVVVETPAGRLGLSICYDLRFPELYRRLLDEGAQLVAIPSAFTAFTGRAHWEPLVRARAIENLVFVIAAAQVGQHAKGRETYGHSMVVDPWGSVLAERAEGAGLVVADIDPDRIGALRVQLPSTEHRRM